MKHFLLIFLMFSITGMYSQKDDFESNIKNTINTFFEGLHIGDNTYKKGYREGSNITNDLYK